MRNNLSLKQKHEIMSFLQRPEELVKVAEMTLLDATQYVAEAVKYEVTTNNLKPILDLLDVKPVRAKRKERCDDITVLSVMRTLEALEERMSKVERMVRGKAEAEVIERVTKDNPNLLLEPPPEKFPVDHETA